MEERDGCGTDHLEDPWGRLRAHPGNRLSCPMKSHHLGGRVSLDTALVAATPTNR